MCIHPYNMHSLVHAAIWAALRAGVAFPRRWRPSARGATLPRPLGRSRHVALVVADPKASWSPIGRQTPLNSQRQLKKSRKRVSRLSTVQRTGMMPPGAGLLGHYSQRASALKPPRTPLLNLKVAQSVLPRICVLESCAIWVSASHRASKTDSRHLRACLGHGPELCRRGSARRLPKVLKQRCQN